MKVQVWKSVVDSYMSPSTIMRHINGNGFEVPGPLSPGMGTGVHVPGVIYFLGGRKSIEKVFANTPGGAFHGKALFAAYTRVAKFPKTYTIVAIASTGFGDAFTLPRKGNDRAASDWIPLVGAIAGSGRNPDSIPYADVINALWGSENKMQGYILAINGVPDGV